MDSTASTGPPTRDFHSSSAVVKDERSGEVIELHCTYDPESRGGGTADGRKVKGTLHWVSAEHAVPANKRSFVENVASR